MGIGLAFFCVTLPHLVWEIGWGYPLFLVCFRPKTGYDDLFFDEESGTDRYRVRSAHLDAREHGHQERLKGRLFIVLLASGKEEGIATAEEKESPQNSKRCRNSTDEGP